MRSLSALSLVLLLGGIACELEPATDPWMVPGGSVFWPMVPYENIVPVKDMARAVELLQSVYWVRLDAGEYKKLTQAELQPDAAQPYLLRAVSYSQLSGYRVTHDGTQVSVANSTMGEPSHVYRVPVVVHLGFEPSRLFVSCSTDL